MPGYLLVIDDNPTVLKVVELALTEAGYEIATAADGEAALALVRQARTVPDLVLLDGLIPGRDALDFCRQLAAEPGLSRVPVVVMESRGTEADAEARFARAPNVVDRISKPFSPEALRTVIARVVPGGGRGNGQKPPPADPAGPSPAVRAAVEEALSRSAESAVAEARAFAAQGLALAGDLDAISMSQILETLAEQAHSGVLRVVNTESNARVELFFRLGRVDFAAAVGVAEELLLGRFAVEAGELDAQALGRVLEERAAASGVLPLLGADLIGRGLLDREALARAMARQTSELCYETLRWHAGFFQFRRAAVEELPPVAREAALGLNVDRMLLEGYRRVDEWRVIEREIASFDEVFIRNENKIAEVPRGTFTREELHILDQIDGRQSVRDIVRKLRMGSFDVSKAFFRFRRAHVVRRRVAPTAI